MNVREKIIRILRDNKFVFLHASRQAGVTVNSLIQLSKEKAEHKYFVCNKNSRSYVKGLINQYCSDDTTIIVLTFNQYLSMKITEFDVVVFDNILFELNEQMDGCDVIKALNSNAKKIWIVETCGIKFNVFATIMEIFNNDINFKYFGLVKEDENQKKKLGSKYDYEYLLDYFKWLDSRNEITKKYFNLRYKTDELRVLSASNTNQDFIEINLFKVNRIGTSITSSGYAQIPDNATVSYGIDFATSKDSDSTAVFNTSGYSQLNGGLLTGSGEFKPNGCLNETTTSITTSGSAITIGNGSNLLTNGTSLPTNWWNQPYWQDFSLTNPWYKQYQTNPIMHDKHSISIDLELSKEQYYELTSELIKNNISFSEFLIKKLFDNK